MPESSPARCHWCQQPFKRIVSSGLIHWRCSSDACFLRQQRWKISILPKTKAKTATPKCLYLPLPKQVDAIEAVESRRYRWLLYGGARGGAKSHFLRWFAYMKCLAIPGFQCLLLRRTYPELEKTHMRRVPAEVSQLGGLFIPSAKPPVVKFPKSSVLEFGHCQDAQDVVNYLSAEYHLVLIDELGTFEEDMIIKIASSARLRHPEFKPCIVAATNPGALWVKDRWIDKSIDPDRYPDYNPDEYCFIQSLLDDNPYPDPEYEAFLNALDPDTKAAWRWGRWDVFEGQYFKEFRRDRHCEVLDIPSELPRIGGFDWGYSPDPAVMLWAVVLPDGHLHIEREATFRETIAAEVAQQVLQLTRDYQLQLGVVFCDPSMKIRSGQSGESIYETVARAGLPVVVSNHERVNGWQRVRHWLRANPATGKPWLTINPDNCPQLCRTLPALTHDDTKREDVDTDGPDHWSDALRYLVMGRPAPPAAKLKPPSAPGTAGWLFHELALANQTGAILGIDAVRPR